MVAARYPATPRPPASCPADAGGVALEGLEGRCLLSTTITEFPTPTAGSTPWWITSGLDGNLWFTEFDANRIGKINPTTHAYTEYDIPTPNSYPEGIAYGDDGNVWFAQPGDAEIGILDPTTGSVSELPVPSGAGPVELALDPAGNIWFSELLGRIGMINPTTHAIREFNIPNPHLISLNGITLGPDGNIWFAGFGVNYGEVGMINTANYNITQLTVPSGGAVYNIATGPNGNLWFTEPYGGRIGMVNINNDAITEFPVPGTGSGIFGPDGIAGGADGHVWFTDLRGQIGMIDTSSDAITEFPINESGSSPYAITQGDDGNLWFADGGDNSVGVVTLDVQMVPIEQPVAVVAGSPFGVTVAAEYSTGGFDPYFDGTLTASLASGLAGTGLGGTIAVTATGGEAYFEDLLLYIAYDDYTVHFTTGNGVTGPSTGPIDVTPGPPITLAVYAEPPGAATAGAPFGAGVLAEDAYGNVATTFSGSVSVAAQSGAGPLQGTTTVTAVNGEASFNNLVDDKAQTISLTFAANGLSSAVSTSIVINPAPATQLVVAQQPSFDGDGRAGLRHPAGDPRGGRLRQRGDGRQQHGGHGRAVQRRRAAAGDDHRHRRQGRRHLLRPRRRQGRVDHAEVQRGRPDECRLDIRRREPGGGQPARGGAAALVDGDGRAGVRHPAGDPRGGCLRQRGDGRQQHGRGGGPRAAPGRCRARPPPPSPRVWPPSRTWPTTRPNRSR